MKVNNSKNSINFKGIEYNLVKKTSMYQVSHQLMASTPKNTRCIVFIDSPLYAKLHDKVAKLGDELNWVLQHLELKGIKLEFPKSMTDEKVEMFCIHGKSEKKYVKEVLGNKLQRIARSFIKSKQYEEEAGKITTDPKARDFLASYLEFNNQRTKFQEFINKHRINKIVVWDESKPHQIIKKN